MRSVLAFCLLFALCASANAAKAHHVYTRHHVIVGRSQGVIGPGQGVTAPGNNAPRFAVPGWSDDATRRWLDNASASWSHA